MSHCKQKPVSTGIIYHSCNDSTIAHNVLSNESSADKVIKFCFGYDHLILLKDKAFIQRLSSCDDNLFDACYQQLRALNLSIVDIAFGRKHGIALSEDFEAWSFGDNSYGQLGIGYIGNRPSASAPSLFLIEHLLKLKQRIISVQCGEYHSCALSQTGDVYTWGSGKYGVLGTAVLANQATPRYVAHFPTRKEFITRIACGPQACAAISVHGRLYQWGYGQSTPLRIIIGEELKIKKVSIGNQHTVCLTQCGKLYAWGLSMYGQLGIDATDNKKVSTPLLLKQFEHVEVTDIECCSLYTVVCTESHIFILGYNDTLFQKKQHFRAYAYPLPCVAMQEQPLPKICCFGCSRHDFAVLTKSAIHKLSPSICCAHGSDVCISGHGIYVTPFRPTVQYILRDRCILHSGCFVTDDYESVQIQCCTPNFTKFPEFLSVEYPMKIQVTVAIDGKYYTDPVDMYVVQTPSKSQAETFELTPNCGDMSGDIQCVITDRSQYISALTATPDLPLNHLTVQLVASTLHDDNDENKQQQTYVVNASVCDGDANAIQFVLPPLNVGTYRVFLALDGPQNFVDIHQSFTVYNVQCMQCSSDIINLSDSENEIDLEIEVVGFAYTDRKNIKLKFSADSHDVDGDKHAFIQDAIYESQSARDIAANEAKTKQEYEAKRGEIETAKSEELQTLAVSAKSEDEAREKWLAQTEKDRKKKKKPADLEAFEAEIQSKNDEWTQKLKERESAQREIERKYRKQLVSLNKAESRLESAKPSEQDDGHGYIRCKLDVCKLRQWQQPCSVQIGITCNGALYSALCSITSIRPRVSRVSPKLGLFSAATKVKLYVAGFTLDAVNKLDLQVCIEDEQVDEFEIGRDDAANGECFVAMTVNAFKSNGVKAIKIKYGQVFEIAATFWAHQVIKIASVLPKEWSVAEDGEVKIQFAAELNEEYVEDDVQVEIKANEHKIVWTSALELSTENKKECKVQIDSGLLGTVGTAKKAQCQISLNRQQWIAAKPVAIK